MAAVLIRLTCDGPIGMLGASKELGKETAVRAPALRSRGIRGGISAPVHKADRRSGPSAGSPPRADTSRGAKATKGKRQHMLLRNATTNLSRRQSAMRRLRRRDRKRV